MATSEVGFFLVRVYLDVNVDLVDVDECCKEEHSLNSFASHPRPDAHDTAMDIMMIQGASPTAVSPAAESCRPAASSPDA